MCVASGKYDGLAYDAAVDAIAADLAAKGLGEKKITFRLRDWGISRQRYWGTPIPIVHCATCGDVPVPEKDLPVVLPEDCVPDGTGNPLAKRRDFIDTTCPKCGGPGQRETDTMDTFVDSSWYYMRYACPDAKAMVDARNDYWNPMDQYIGGITHAILHLLYARFWTKVMRDMGYVRMDEPFTRLLTQGMVLNHIYFRRTEKGGIDYFPPAAVEVRQDEAGRTTGVFLKADGQPVEDGGVGTMSKSKLNGVDPQDMVDRYGADAARLYVMFAAPPEATFVWSDAGVEGAQRFLRRLWTFADANAAAIGPVGATPDFADASAAVKAARRELHQTLKQATYDYDRIQYNTVVSAGMKMLNALEAVPADAAGRTALFAEGLSILIRVLYPVSRTSAARCGTSSATRESSARFSMRRGRRWIRPRSRRTRSSSCCRSTASFAASSPSPRKRTARPSKRRRARAPKSRNTRPERRSSASSSFPGSSSMSSSDEQAARASLAFAAAIAGRIARRRGDRTGGGAIRSPDAAFICAATSPTRSRRSTSIRRPACRSPPT